MGTGFHGGFGNTYGGSHYAYGDASFMGDKDQFLKNIKNRSDVDVNGYFDLIAHGTAATLEVDHNGNKIYINSRTTAKLIKQMPGYKGQNIRLLSCNTGAVTSGFAQNLANKLNVNVSAPTSLLWADKSGKHFVADGKYVNGILVPDMSKPGYFKTYKPQRRSKS